jgi:hypothetical protein
MRPHSTLVRLNHLWGQSWMRLLIATSLCFDIRIICLHIPGVDNPIADGLSRYFQETTDQLRRMSLQCRSMYANMGQTGVDVKRLWERIE